MFQIFKADHRQVLRQVGWRKPANCAAFAGFANGGGARDDAAEEGGRNPMLVFSGQNVIDHDFALGVELAEASIKLCPNGRLKIFPQANHWLQHEEAGEVSRQLVDFLKAQPDPEQ